MHPQVRLIPRGVFGLSRLLGRLVALLAPRGSGATGRVRPAVHVVLAAHGQEHLKMLGTEMAGRIIGSHVDDVTMYVVDAASFGSQGCGLIFCAGAEVFGFTAGALASC
jgi:hypothetical protein